MSAAVSRKPEIESVVGIESDIASKKVLVAIANHGTKNRPFLDRLLSEYRSWPCETRFAILSNIPKDDLGEDCEVHIGAPSPDPWSLPFAHRPIFEQAVDDYDLFIYSEDDTFITERNLRAYLIANEVLEDDEMPGFLRYEEVPDGSRTISSVHSHYHFRPGETRSVRGLTFSRYSNEHSALFILTRDQLRRCIDSGGFLVPPHRGRYDMLCSAATDPYTRCGFRRLICVSQIDDFFLHHMPNVYIGKLGVPESEFREEIEAVIEVAEGARSREELFESETRLDLPRWDKSYHEPARDDVLALMPGDPSSVLSIGAASGRTEIALVERGARVTAIPMDQVSSIHAEKAGVEILLPEFDAAFESLAERTFETVLLVDVLQYLASPVALLERARDYLAPGGRVIVASPNLRHRSVSRLRIRDEQTAGEIDKLGDYERAGFHATDVGVVRSWLRSAGLQPGRVEYRYRARGADLPAVVKRLGARWLATDIVMEGRA